MTKDIYNLSCDTYSDNLKNMVQEMSKSNKFTDVTLVSDDKKQKRVHKFILCAFSKVFESIIENNPEKNSIIYLKGIKYKELESVLDYIYYGETQVSLENVTEFLHVANTLEIKEFQKVKEEKAVPSTSQQDKFEDTVHKTSYSKKDSKSGIDESDKDLDKSNQHEMADNDTAEQVIDISIEDNANPLEDVSNKAVENYVDSEEKEKETNEDEHLETINYKMEKNKTIAGPKTRKEVNERTYVHAANPFQCNQCNYKSHVKANLYAHKQRKHSGITYACEYIECERKFQIKAKLNIHIKTAHEGFRFSCNYCKFKSASKKSVKVHTESKHEGIRYTCNICNIKFSLQHNLKKHVQIKHEGMRHECNFCNKKMVTNHGLKLHILRRHTKYV